MSRWHSTWQTDVATDNVKLDCFFLYDPSQPMDAQTAGYGLGFSATLFLSTVLRALPELIYGGEIHHYQAYVLRLETYCGLGRK